MRSMGWLRSDRLASVGVVFTSSLRIGLQVVPDTCTSCSVLLGYMSALDVVRVSVPQYTLLTVHPAFVQHTKRKVACTLCKVVHKVPSSVQQLFSAICWSTSTRECRGLVEETHLVRENVGDWLR